jgi:hypothetical protein
MAGVTTPGHENPQPQCNVTRNADGGDTSRHTTATHHHARSWTCGCPYRRSMHFRPPSTLGLLPRRSLRSGVVIEVDLAYRLVETKTQNLLGMNAGTQGEPGARQRCCRTSNPESPKLESQPQVQDRRSGGAGHAGAGTQDRGRGNSDAGAGDAGAGDAGARDAGAGDAGPGAREQETQEQGTREQGRG